MKVLGRGAAMLALLVILTGCETLDAVTGKNRLRQDLDIAQTESYARIGELQERNSALEKERRDLNAELDALQARHATALKELETLNAEIGSAAGRINVLLFRGDIVYAIVPTAFGDYRAGLRLHSLNDAAFEQALQKFEMLQGGDGALLRVLRQIDADDDRVIRTDEARDYREQQESSLNRED